jgi:hypothetical protein
LRRVRFMGFVFTVVPGGVTCLYDNVQGSVALGEPIAAPECMSGGKSRRFLVIGGFLGLGTALAVASFVLRPDRPVHENMPAEGGRYGLVRLRTWSGVLIDAGCLDRSDVRPATPQAGSLPAQSQAPSEGGINVGPDAARAERQDALAHQVPDLLSRQPDAGCAITGATRGFALYLPDGQLKNLDEGGNTKALEVLESTSAGQGGEKPRVTVRGRLAGDRIVVESIQVS